MRWGTIARRMAYALGLWGTSAVVLVAINEPRPLRMAITIACSVIVADWMFAREPKQ